MSLGTGVVLLLLAAAVAGVVRTMARDRKRGKTCGCGCSGCAGCRTAAEKPEKEKEQP